MGVSVLEPVLPDYQGGCLSNIIPALCAPNGPRNLPAWMPDCVEGASRVVVLLLDGLGWNQFRSHVSHMPTLSGFSGGHVTTIAPSTTATALTSLVTGLSPGEHGLIGYRVDMGSTVMNVLRWGDVCSRPRRPSRARPFSG